MIVTTATTPGPHRTSVETLLTWLGAQQQRVLGVVDGLDEPMLRAPVLPSGWTCLGMVQHLAVATRFWLREIMTGIPSNRSAAFDDFVVPDDVPAGEVLGSYEREIALGAQAVRGLPLGTPPAWWPEGLWGDWRLDDLEEVLLHLLVETTCHAGHLDAARELLDRRTWDYELGRLGEPVTGRSLSP